MAVKDVISPFAYACLQFVGYTVFAIAWIAILAAALRALLDAQRILFPPAPRLGGKLLTFPPAAARRASRG